VPEATPDTIPVAEPTAATAGVALVQVPPPASDKVTVAPEHTLSGPPMGAGRALTVSGMVLAQPSGSV